MKQIVWKISVYLIGFIILAYGLYAVIEERMVTEGNAFKAGWHLQGSEAVFVGAVIAVFGLYIIYVVYKFFKE
jgi:hypothetical protein